MIAQLAYACGIFTLGLIVGLVIEVSRGRFDTSGTVTHVANEHDAALMDYLEKSECNLYFNVQMGSWGLIDGKDKLVATGPTVRSTLARAILNDRQEVANAGTF